MRLICTIVFISLCFLAAGQKINYPLYSSKDTTFTFSYPQSIQIGKSIERVSILEKEVSMLKESGVVKDMVIRKLQLRDTLMQIELNLSKEIELSLKEKIKLGEEVQSNYKKLVFSAEEQLKAEKKERGIQETWKNIYKYGYPVLAGIITVLILK